MKYFAYGSNMLEEWIRAPKRVPKAKFSSIGYVTGRQLRFHKISKDESGKCDMPKTGTASDVVYGVIFDVPSGQMKSLDLAEGAGNGYARAAIEVFCDGAPTISATTYLADSSHTDPHLAPYSWYRDLILAGARQHHLPDPYIDQLAAVVAVEDPDKTRSAPALEALKQYNEHGKTSGLRADAAEIPKTSESRVEGLITQIKASLQPGLQDNVQSILAELISFLPIADTPEYSHVIGLLEVAFVALLSDKPNVKLAKSILAKVRRMLPWHVRLLGRLSLTPPVRVVLGLGALLYFVIPLFIVYGPQIIRQEKIVGIPADMLVMVAVAGAVGSIVSIMVRIQDFASAKNADPGVLFFTGLFKPLIGSAFAMFVFAVLKSGLMPITITPGSDSYFFLALSFIAGFSERFARDIASKTELQLAGKRGHDTA